MRMIKADILILLSIITLIVVFVTVRPYPEPIYIERVVTVYNTPKNYESILVGLTSKCFESVSNSVGTYPIVCIESLSEKDELVSTQVFTSSDIDLIALVTMAEAEGESEYGKVLVIDTVLNRVRSSHFPNTVFDVVYQKNQFSSMWNGRADRCTSLVSDEIRQLVLNEISEITNSEVIFFNAYHYSTYGEPLFQVGNHYFSSYE